MTISVKETKNTIEISKIKDLDLKVFKVAIIKETLEIEIIQSMIF